MQEHRNKFYRWLLRRRLYHIVAIEENSRLIGYDNKLPWKCEPDMKHFKRTTMGHIVIMGRNTWNSLPAKLPGRVNIVITSCDANVKPINGCEPDYIIDSLDGIYDLFINNPELAKFKKVFIIGGQVLYSQTMPYVDNFIISVIPRSYSTLPVNLAASQLVEYPEIPRSLKYKSHELVEDVSVCVYRRRKGKV